MRLELGPSLEAVRARTLTLIDSSASAAALAVRDPALAAMDALRLAEATELGQRVDEPEPGEFPMLELVQGEGSLREKAQLVIDLSTQTQAMLVAIEGQRLAAKEEARLAASVVALRAISLPKGEP